MFIGDDADNVRYNPSNNTALVSYKTTNGGAIAAIDLQTWKVTREFVFASRPESFQLDLGGQRLFANLPRGVRATNDGVVAAVDLLDGKPLAQIPLNGLARNFPMAFDAAHQRLFVATRRPARLIEIDTRAYKVATQIECGEDSDDLFYDAQRNDVTVIAGGYRPDLSDTNTIVRATSTNEIGSLDIFSIGAEGALTLAGRVMTAPHGRTGLYVPARSALYLFTPFKGEREAEVREYQYGVSRH
jgi:hypothetical protein